MSFKDACSCPPTVPSAGRIRVEPRAERTRQGTTIEQVAESISPSLKKNAVAGKINGKPVDLNRPIEEDSHIGIITLDSQID
ncbi:TGS domain-containing protein [Cohnella sp. NL03-T5]|nr:TGS domain-containing protein [Cohnella silvisoli]